jgi:two-component system OmpR family sensor kinase
VSQDGGRPAPWTEAERAVLRRARRRVSVPVGLVVTLLVTLVGGIAYARTVQAQHEQVRREVRYVAATGEAGAPPGCTWLFALDDGVVDGGPAPAPAGFPLRGDLDRVAATGSPVERTVERNGTVYLVRTEPRAGGAAIQAVFDERYQLADRRHLLVALGIAELVGLLAAAATGLLVGRTAVAPLAEALGRQRRFVTDASHELRTPITRISTRVQVLAREAEAAQLPAGHRAGLKQLAGTARRLGEIVDDLLLSARLAATAADPGRRPVDLADITERAAAAEVDRAAEGRLAITVVRPGEPLLVDGVDSALRRVVGELLTNAMAHTPPGGRIDVRVGRATAAGLVELTVADTGNGFDPAQADRIFDRFHRGAGGPDRRYGLGLALLNEIVASHRGTIEAAAAPGRGARFTVRLPAAAAAVARTGRTGRPSNVP